MPTYDYLCRSCGHELELFQAMSERPKRKCPACGELRLRRLIGSGAGVVFKGAGFYQTDYRSKSYHEAARKDRAPAEGSSSKSDGKQAAGDSSKTEKRASENGADA